MKAQDIMSENIQTVAPTATLVEAGEMMRSFNVGFLPVCADGDLVGVLTDRDIVTRTTARGFNPMTEKVRDAMSKEVISASPNHDIEDVARLMEAKQVRRIVIVDDKKRVCGVVSLGDISRFGGHRDLSAEILISVSEPMEELL